MNLCIKKSKSIKRHYIDFYMNFFFLKNSRWRIFNIVFFWHLFLEALAFVRNFKMQKFWHFLEKQNPKKHKKIAKKIFQNGR
jgi:hypothetical protein